MFKFLRTHGLCSQPGSSVHRISRQEYWSELPFPPPQGLPDPGIEPTPPALPACASCIGRRILYHWATKEALSILYIVSRVCICQYQSPNSSHHAPPPGCNSLCCHHPCVPPSTQILTTLEKTHGFWDLGTANTTKLMPLIGILTFTQCCKAWNDKGLKSSPTFQQSVRIIRSFSR